MENKPLSPFDLILGAYEENKPEPTTKDDERSQNASTEPDHDLLSDDLPLSYRLARGFAELDNKKNEDAG